VVVIGGLALEWGVSGGPKQDMEMAYL